MTTKHMKRCLTSLVIREVKTETKMIYPFIPPKMAIIKMIENNKCWQGCRQIGTLVLS